MARKPTQQKRSPAPPRAPERGSRAPLIAAGLALALGVAAAWWFIGRSQPVVLETTPEQNVLIVTIDTLRADALGAYGGAARTPNLDALAAGGIRFTFAHAHAVMTLPSHGSIMTGRYPYEHGARDNAGFRVSSGVRTIAEAAKDKGFATGAFVGAFPLDRQFGLARGFDVYDDVGGQQAAGADFSFTERQAEQVVTAATRWISGQQQRWLAWVHVFDPHAPYAPPAPFASQYAGNPYAGEVAYTDHALAPLLQLARQSSRPTLVIVTADHGEGLGEHQEATHGIFAYESTLKVPLIVAQVGGGRQGGRGTVSDAPVQHVDIAATIAARTGLSMPDGLPGRDLAASAAAPDESRVSYFEAMTAMLKRGWAPLRGVIAGRDKYVELPVEELYDLARDPKEERNRVAAAAERTRELAVALRTLGAPLPGEQADENADVRARLQSLGYLSGSAARKKQYTEADDPKRLIDVDRLMLQGIELHRGGRTGEAIDAYRQVLARRPDMQLGYRRLAYLQWEAGQTSAAIATLREALAKNGPDLEVDIRLGTYLAETGASADAIAMLEKAASAAPQNTEGLNALGIAYARTGRTADSRRTFERVLSIDSRDAYALENLGTVHLQEGNAAAARQAFEEAIAVSQRSSRAHAGLGAIASHAGRDEEAIAHWRNAVGADPANFDALFNLTSSLIRTGRTSEARPLAEDFVRRAPTAFYGRDIEQFRRWLGR